MLGEDEDDSMLETLIRHSGIEAGDNDQAEKKPTAGVASYTAQHPHRTNATNANGDRYAVADTTSKLLNLQLQASAQNAQYVDSMRQIRSKMEHAVESLRNIEQQKDNPDGLLALHQELVEKVTEGTGNFRPENSDVPTTTFGQVESTNYERIEELMEQFERLVRRVETLEYNLQYEKEARFAVEEKLRAIARAASD